MFFDRGVPVTISTDDPAMFETSLLREYQLAADTGFTAAEITRLVQSSFEHSLLPADQKHLYISAIREATARTTPKSRNALL
jgi:adenosine deaminase